MHDVRPLLWPDGKAFAFTIFDDTDLQTRDNGPPVYEFLRDIGLRTTKSVWTLAGTESAPLAGTTCADAEYAGWVQALQDQGFEIASHGATYHTSTRERTIAGIERFVELFGHPPRSHANHSTNREGIYWGAARLTGLRRRAYALVNRARGRPTFAGHTPGSELFWGDVCRDRITYVRNFVFPDIDTLAACPYMPYHDPRRPFVNRWFAASNGPDVDTFVATIDESSQDRLAHEGGACIMYTHLACGFTDGGILHPRFRSLMERLSGKNGWFVPVGTLLDHLEARRGPHHLSGAERRELEVRWLRQKVGTPS